MAEIDALQAILGQQKRTKVPPREAEETKQQVSQPPEKRKPQKPSADGLIKITMRFDEEIMDACWALCEKEGMTREILIEAIVQKFLVQKNKKPVFELVRQREQERRSAAAKRKASKRRKK